MKSFVILIIFCFVHAAFANDALVNNSFVKLGILHKHSESWRGKSLNEIVKYTDSTKILAISSPCNILSFSYSKDKMIVSSELSNILNSKLDNTEQDHWHYRGLDKNKPIAHNIVIISGNASFFCEYLGSNRYSISDGEKYGTFTHIPKRTQKKLNKSLHSDADKRRR